MGGVTYAFDYKDSLPGGGYHQYDNLVGPGNRGNVMFFISEYMRVNVVPSFSGGSAIPPVAGGSYRIPSRDNVMYCPANDTNLPEDNFPFGSQWYPDYLLRGFGTLNADGFGDVVGYPSYGTLSLTQGGAKKTLLQDMIYLPGVPLAFQNHYTKFNNHFANNEPTGGNVTAADGSVAFIPANDFFRPVDFNRVAAPFGYYSSMWGFPPSSGFAPSTATVAQPNGITTNTNENYRIMGY